MKRVEEAVRLFEQGYNCSQAVFAAYADLFEAGMDRELALRLSCPMGGGVGRMREVCGTVTAMALLSGLKDGNTDPEDQKKKEAAYQRVRTMSDAFRERNGAILCRELLELSEREESAAPTLRTREYYQSRPCSRFVREAAILVETYLIQSGE